MYRYICTSIQMLAGMFCKHLHYRSNPCCKLRVCVRVTSILQIPTEYTARYCCRVNLHQSHAFLRCPSPILKWLRLDLSFMRQWYPTTPAHTHQHTHMDQHAHTNPRMHKYIHTHTHTSTRTDQHAHTPTHTDTHIHPLSAMFQHMFIFKKHTILYLLNFPLNNWASHYTNSIAVHKWIRELLLVSEKSNFLSDTALNKVVLGSKAL